MTFEGWTVDDVLALKPCPKYTESCIRELWAGRERLTIAEVCDLPIPAVNRIWLLCHAPWEIIEPAITAIVERAVRTHPLPNPVTGDWGAEWAAWAAVEAARQAASEAADAAVVAVLGEDQNVERERQIEDFRRLARGEQ